MHVAPVVPITLLACPVCKGALAAAPAGTGLVCEPCRVSFRVEDGIFRLMPGDGSPTAQ